MGVCELNNGWGKCGTLSWRIEKQSRGILLFGGEWSLSDLEKGRTGLL